MNWSVLRTDGLYRISMLLLCLVSAPAHADVADTLVRIKPGVVGVGSVHPTRAPRAQLRGSGFAVRDGTLVVTCAHVVDQPLAADKNERLAVFTGRGTQMETRPARVVAIDRERDLAVLKIGGTPLPALTLGDAARAREGWQLYLTGFPLGPILGLHPLTHRAGLAAIVPLVTPLTSSARLSPKLIKLARDPYPVFMLDAVAYPGHSGSPVWHPDTGEVYGIVNAVFVKGAKETVLSAPSGISYAMPVSHLQELLKAVPGESTE